jgi:hypothetical protein
MSLHRPGAWMLCLLALVGGCGSAVGTGRSTLIEGDDLLRITDNMAMKIAGSEAVQQAIAREGALKVVVLPAENRMRAEVLPTGVRDAFTARVRSLLARHARDQFVWVMNRDEFYRMRRRELQPQAEAIDLGPPPQSIQPRYALSATFYSMSNETSEQRSTTYLVVFELSDLDRRTTLWTDKYEMKKSAVKGFLD